MVAPSSRALLLASSTSPLTFRWAIADEQKRNSDKSKKLVFDFAIGEILVDLKSLQIIFILLTKFSRRCKILVKKITSETKW
jgi:hypothetical protein